MIELQHDELVFQFPEVHADAVCRVDFQQTLRIPDDNREYPLPPGLAVRLTVVTLRCLLMSIPALITPKASGSRCIRILALSYLQIIRSC